MHSENPMDMLYDAYPRSRPHGIDCLMDPKGLGLEEGEGEANDTGLLMSRLGIP